MIRTGPPVGVTVIASLVTLPVATMADGADSVAPVTDKLTVIANGAPEATLTTTPPEGVVFSSVIATGKGAPGLALSHTSCRLVRPANTLGGRAVRWLSLSRKVRRLLRPAKSVGGRVVR